MPRSPQCLLCPVAKFCKARHSGLQDLIPEKRKKRAREQITLAAAVFLDPRGQTLLLPPPTISQKHATHEQVIPLVSKMWHFPTISVRDDAQAELREFVSNHILPVSKNGSPQLHALTKDRHAVTFRAIALAPFRIMVNKLPQVDGAKVILLSELAAPTSLAVSNLTRKIAKAALAQPTAMAAR